VRRRPAVALLFAAAAAFSAWNPLAAPFGLLVGIGATVLAVRALRSPHLRGATGAADGRARTLALAALVLALAAVLGSAAVLARTAGVGRGAAGADVVAAPAAGERARTLDEGAEATREARGRAREELEAVEREGTRAGAGRTAP
jgi:hypothetical protein